MSLVMGTEQALLANKKAAGMGQAIPTQSKLSIAHKSSLCIKSYNTDLLVYSWQVLGKWNPEGWCCSPESQLRGGCLPSSQFWLAFFFLFSFFYSFYQDHYRRALCVWNISVEITNQPPRGDNHSNKYKVTIILTLAWATLTNENKLS